MQREQYLNYPRIRPVALDSGTSFRVEYAPDFPSQAVMTALSSAGAEKIYTFRFNREEARILNPKLNYDRNSNIELRKITDTEEQLKLHTDRDVYYITNFPEKMRGGYLVSMSYSGINPDANPNATTSKKDLIRFEINRSATVYYLIANPGIRPAWMDQEGFVTADQETLITLNNGNPSGGYSFYSKHYNVPEGCGETLAVSLGGPGIYRLTGVIVVFD